MESNQTTIRLQRKVVIRFQTKHVFYALLLIESSILLYVSLMPGDAVPALPTYALRPGDIGHFLAYIIYGFLMERSLKYAGIAKHRYMLAMMLAVFFAGITELLQVIPPGRYPDFLDWTVDSLGIAFGAFFRKN